jgi:predicted nucleotide-binding protein (sugar kinase/HSP70/actin superfamily)
MNNDKNLRIEGLIQEGPPPEEIIACYPSIGVMNSLIDGFVDAVGTGDRTVRPPPNTKKTLDIGTLYAPEGACLPFKLILGNLKQCLDNGANTVGMITERGPCRLGFYSLGMQLIFSDLGLNAGWFDFNNMSVRKGYVQRLRAVYRKMYGRNVPYFRVAISFIIGFSRLHATERLEAERNRLLPYEINHGNVQDAFEKGKKAINKCNHPPTIWMAFRKARKQLRSIPLDRSRKTVKVLIGGEVFCALDSFTNANLETRLARLGAEPFRVVWQTTYLLWGMKLDFLNPKGKRAAIRASRKYMGEYIGGDCSTNVGYALMAPDEGLDGMVHLKPFGCMVEFVAQNVLAAIERDTGFSVLSLTLDDLSAGERFSVRLEAFIDNLFQKKYGTTSR